jgi:hypothetical protein
MSLARDPADVIDYWIPVKGDLKQPVFNVKDVVWDIVRNIFVKPPMTPYLMHVKRMENVVDKMLSINWEVRKTTLPRSQEKFVKTMAKFLKQNPEATITISPQVYEIKEKEHIAFFEGKKKYFLSTQNKGYKMSEDDSLEIEEMSVKDEGFVGYLAKLGRDSMMFTTEHRCRYLVGDALIEARFQQLNAARKKTFLEIFEKTGTTSQIKFTASESGIPFNGFSRYRVNYNGDVPEKLRKAYEEIEEMNEQAPRKKYKDKRWLPKVKGIKRLEARKTNEASSN